MSVAETMPARASALRLSITGSRRMRRCDINAAASLASALMSAPQYRKYVEDEAN